MNRAARFVLFVASLALITAACGSTTNVSTTDDQRPTPLPTQASVFIPTTAPTLPSPTPQDADSAADAASNSETADGAGEIATAEADPSATPTPTPSDDGDGEQRPTALVTAVPLAIQIAPAEPQPTQPPRPTQAPQPTRVPAAQSPTAPAPAPPAPQPPAPRPTNPPPPQCPGGQVLTVSGCSCPVGTVSTTSGCFRLCNQSDLTITGTCLCTGELYDNGGQCVKRCNAGEIQDRYGGCRRPNATDSN